MEDSIEMKTTTSSTESIKSYSRKVSFSDKQPDIITSLKSNIEHDILESAHESDYEEYEITDLPERKKRFTKRKNSCGSISNEKIYNDIELTSDDSNEDSSLEFGNKRVFYWNREQLDGTYSMQRRKKNPPLVRSISVLSDVEILENLKEIVDAGLKRYEEYIDSDIELDSEYIYKILVDGKYDFDCNDFNKYTEEITKKVQSLRNNVSKFSVQIDSSVAGDITENAEKHSKDVTNEQEPRTDPILNEIVYDTSNVMEINVTLRKHSEEEEEGNSEKNTIDSDSIKNKELQENDDARFKSQNISIYIEKKRRSSQSQDDNNNTTADIKPRRRRRCRTRLRSSSEKEQTCSSNKDTSNQSASNRNSSNIRMKRSARQELRKQRAKFIDGVSSENTKNGCSKGLDAQHKGTFEEIISPVSVIEVHSIPSDMDANLSDDNSVVGARVEMFKKHENGRLFTGMTTRNITTTQGKDVNERITNNRDSKHKTEQQQKLPLQQDRQKQQENLEIQKSQQKATGIVQKSVRSNNKKSEYEKFKAKTDDNDETDLKYSRINMKSDKDIEANGEVGFTPFKIPVKVRKHLKTSDEEQDQHQRKSTHRRRKPIRNPFDAMKSNIKSTSVKGLKSVDDLLKDEKKIDTDYKSNTECNEDEDLHYVSFPNIIESDYNNESLTKASVHDKGMIADIVEDEIIPDPVIIQETESQPERNKKRNIDNSLCMKLEDSGKYRQTPIKQKQGKYYDSFEKLRKSDAHVGIAYQVETILSDIDIALVDHGDLEDIGGRSSRSSSFFKDEDIGKHVKGLVSHIDQFIEEENKEFERTKNTVDKSNKEIISERKKDKPRLSPINITRSPNSADTVNEEELLFSPYSIMKSRKEKRDQDNNKDVFPDKLDPAPSIDVLDNEYCVIELSEAIVDVVLNKASNEGSKQHQIKYGYHIREGNPLSVKSQIGNVITDKEKQIVNEVEIQNEIANEDENIFVFPEPSTGMQSTEINNRSWRGEENSITSPSIQDELKEPRGFEQFKITPENIDIANRMQSILSDIDIALADRGSKGETPSYSRSNSQYKDAPINSHLQSLVTSIDQFIQEEDDSFIKSCEVIQRSNLQLQEENESGDVSHNKYESFSPYTISKKRPRLTSAILRNIDQERLLESGRADSIEESFCVISFDGSVVGDLKLNRAVKINEIVKETPVEYNVQTSDSNIRFYHHTIDYANEDMETDEANKTSGPNHFPNVGVENQELFLPGSPQTPSMKNKVNRFTRQKHLQNKPGENSLAKTAVEELIVKEEYTDEAEADPELNSSPFEQIEEMVFTKQQYLEEETQLNVSKGSNQLQQLSSASTEFQDQRNDNAKTIIVKAEGFILSQPYFADNISSTDKVSIPTEICENNITPKTATKNILPRINIATTSEENGRKMQCLSSSKQQLFEASDVRRNVKKESAVQLLSTMVPHQPFQETNEVNSNAAIEDAKIKAKQLRYVKATTYVQPSMNSMQNDRDSDKAAENITPVHLVDVSIKHDEPSVNMTPVAMRKNVLPQASTITLTDDASKIEQLSLAKSSPIVESISKKNIKKTSTIQIVSTVNSTDTINVMDVPLHVTTPSIRRASTGSKNTRNIASSHVIQTQEVIVNTLSTNQKSEENPIQNECKNSLSEQKTVPKTNNGESAKYEKINKTDLKPETVDGNSNEIEIQHFGVNSINNAVVKHGSDGEKDNEKENRKIIHDLVKNHKNHFEKDNIDLINGSINHASLHNDNVKEIKGTDPIPERDEERHSSTGSFVDVQINELTQEFVNTPVEITSNSLSTETFSVVIDGSEKSLGETKNCNLVDTRTSSSVEESGVGTKSKSKIIPTFYSNPGHSDNNAKGSIELINKHNGRYVGGDKNIEDKKENRSCVDVNNGKRKERNFETASESLEITATSQTQFNIKNTREELVAKDNERKDNTTSGIKPKNETNNIQNTSNKIPLKKAEIKEDSKSHLSERRKESGKSQDTLKTLEERTPKYNNKGKIVSSKNIGADKRQKTISNSLEEAAKKILPSERISHQSPIINLPNEKNSPLTSHQRGSDVNRYTVNPPTENSHNISVDKELKHTTQLNANKTRNAKDGEQKLRGNNFNKQKFLRINRVTDSKTGEDVDLKEFLIYNQGRTFNIREEEKKQSQNKQNYRKPEQKVAEEEMMTQVIDTELLVEAFPTNDCNDSEKSCIKLKGEICNIDHLKSDQFEDDTVKRHEILAVLHPSDDEEINMDQQNEKNESDNNPEQNQPTKKSVTNEVNILLSPSPNKKRTISFVFKDTGNAITPERQHSNTNVNIKSKSELELSNHISMLTIDDSQLSSQKLSKKIQNGSFLSVANLPDSMHKELNDTLGNNNEGDIEPPKWQYQLRKNQGACQLSIQVLLDPNVASRFETETFEYQYLMKDNQIDGYVGEWVLVNCTKTEIEIFIELLRHLLQREYEEANVDEKMKDTRFCRIL